MVVGAPPLGVYSDVSVAFVNHTLEFAQVVGMVVRHHIGERQIKQGERGCQGLDTYVLVSPPFQVKIIKFGQSLKIPNT